MTRKPTAIEKHLEAARELGTANALFRALQRTPQSPLPNADGWLPDLLRYLGQDQVLPKNLRSPLVRTPERARKVRAAVRDWLEAQEQEHPDRQLNASPQTIEQIITMVGLGILEPLLADPDVTEVIVENHASILVEKFGRTIPVSDLAYPSESALQRQVIALCSLSGRPLSRSAPMQTFFFSDGSRVTAVLGLDVAHRGTILSIRRKRSGSFTLENLAQLGALSQEMVAYLQQIVRAWGNILVCGESGCGKTTVLEALLNAMSHRDRGIVVQENDELNPTHPHLRYMLASPDAADKGISLRDCVRFSMLLAPRRIIVGEAKEGEAADLIFAMTSGLSGSMTTIHANPGTDALDRMYIAAMMDPTQRYGQGGEVLRRAIVAAVDVVVHVAFSPTGIRHIDAIHEVWPLTSDGSWDARPVWTAQYGKETSETISWGQPPDYTPSPRLEERLHAYSGRKALEDQPLPETPTQQITRLTRSYRQATTLGGLDRHTEALSVLRTIQDERPGYLDVEQLIKQYQALQSQEERKAAARLSDLQARAEDAAQRGDHATAAWCLDEIETISPEAAASLRESLQAIMSESQENERDPKEE